MSEAYSNLFSLPTNLYAEGAPVLIVAGSLLKHNSTGKILAQLKIQNIQDEIIKAATVKLQPLDVRGNPLGDAIVHPYLDLNIPRDSVFGMQVPIALPDPSTRGFSVTVTEVIFSDLTDWVASGTPWESLPAPVPLEQALQDPELCKQYRIEQGDFCKYQFQKMKDLWLCTCGTLNHQDEAQCHRCTKESAVLSTMDLEALQERKEQRLALEQQKREHLAQQQAEQRANMQAKIKKFAPFALIAVVVLVAMGILASFLLNQGNYPARALYNVIQNNGVYEEEITIPFYAKDKRYTPITFSGYDKRESYGADVQTKISLSVEKNHFGTFYYQFSQTEKLDSEHSSHLIVKITCTKNEKKLDYTYIFSETSDERGKEEVIYVGSFSPNSYRLGNPIPIDEVWVSAPNNSLSIYNLDRFKMDIIPSLLSSNFRVFVSFFNNIIHKNTKLTLANFGFPEDVMASSKKAS